MLRQAHFLAIALPLSLRYVTDKSQIPQTTLNVLVPHTLLRFGNKPEVEKGQGATCASVSYQYLAGTKTIFRQVKITGITVPAIPLCTSAQK